jgi:hypothetical protein
VRVIAQDRGALVNALEPAGNLRSDDSRLAITSAGMPNAHADAAAPSAFATLKSPTSGA